MSTTPEVTFENFDPNGMDSTLWGLYEGGNTFRTFSKRGSVLNAASRCFRFKLYQLKPEGWVLAARQDSNEKNNTCDDCGMLRVKQTYVEDACYSYGWERKAWCWERVRNKIVTPLNLMFLCRGCKNRRAY